MICLFGGTFDPVHLGHIHAAEEVVQALGIDEIRLVLSARPNHKNSTGATVSERWEMLELACVDNPRLVPDDTEIRREKPSYTVDTLLEFKRLYPKESLAWVIGSDAYALLASWYRWEQVLELTNLVVLKRPGYPLQLDAGMAALTEERGVETLSGSAKGGILVLDSAMQAVAAEDIRGLIADGEIAEHLLPTVVATYIKDHHLYGDR